MKSTDIKWVLGVWAICGALAAADTVTHMAFQAVDEDGVSIFNGGTVVTLEGILLNNPEEWLDPTPHFVAQPFYTGGQWEIFIQGENGDDAGTACWMAQNYGNLPNKQHPQDSYTDAEWLAELNRINHDPNLRFTDRPHIFRAGDRVRVTGRHLFRNGKRNINEIHNKLSTYDFTVELIKPAVGLPTPIEITLANLKDGSDGFIFNHAPREGGELYQSRRVRLENVYIVSGTWASGQTLTVADAPSGWTRSFPVRLGYGEGIRRYPAPLSGDMIDVIGIMNQDSQYTWEGYYLVALDYDGNRRILGDASNLRGTIPGDINNDFKVNLADFAELAEGWLLEMPGLYPTL